MDEETMSGSDDEKEKFVSVFGKYNILSWKYPLVVR